MKNNISGNKSSLSKENFIYLLDLLLSPNVRYEREQRSIDYSQKCAYLRKPRTQLAVNNPHLLSQFLSGYTSSAFLLYPHPSRRPNLHSPSEKHAFVCLVPFTVAIEAEVVFSFPRSFRINCLVQQFNMITIAIWTGHVRSIPFLPEAHASQHRNQKMQIAAMHRIYCPKDLLVIFCTLLLTG